MYPESSASLVKTDNVLNTAANASLNLFWDKPDLNRPNGTPYFGLGTNNQVAEFVQTSTDFLEATNEPQLSQAGFFNVISDIAAAGMLTGGSTCVSTSRYNFMPGTSFKSAFGSLWANESLTLCSRVCSGACLGP